MSSEKKSLILVGHPNVGKSQLFNLITGRQVTVSNYPGTTVELTRGQCTIHGINVEVVDSPGLYSLSALSAEEQVTRMLLVKKKPDCVIQVVDARNLPRMLSLTLELLEGELPVILVVNMMDEAKAAGITIDAALLSRRLRIPVVQTSLIKGLGLHELCSSVAQALKNGQDSYKAPCIKMPYPAPLDRELERFAGLLKNPYGLSPRSMAAAMINPDPRLLNYISVTEGILSPVGRNNADLREPLLVLAEVRRNFAEQTLNGVIKFPATPKRSWIERLHPVLVHPLYGSVIMLAVLYFGFYWFVGKFGAGTLVDLLEERLFMGIIAPVINSLAENYLPWGWLRELLALDYGIFTLGLRYTFAIIFPIMATFFLFFSIIEDSGYLPRAAYLINNVMEKIGLNGKAVIPLTLGFGCGTLAVLVTRTLETRRERLQASLLLSLAVPCSAQLGLIIALLSRGSGLLLWLTIIAASFFATAGIGRVLLGRGNSAFCLEVPPLRVPRLKGILDKTVARLKWYLIEVLPLFVGVSLLLWFLRVSGLLNKIIAVLQPLTGQLGLPGETALIFVYGFFRRDYGAAGLFDLSRSGVLSPSQVLTAAVVLTLFLPCVAQFTVLVKEHGLKFALLTAAITASVAWTAGLLVYWFTTIPFIGGILQ